MKNYQETVASRAGAEERPRLGEVGRRALAQTPSGQTLLALSRAAAGLQDLSEAEATRALDHVRFGLEQKGGLLWEGVHLASELPLPASAREELASALRGVVEDTRLAGAVRARALEGYAELSHVSASDAFFEELRTNDESWTVRRAAKDSARRIAKEETLRGALFGRFLALLRCERLRFEIAEEGLEADDLRRLGLRLPPALLSFFMECFVGGRLIHLELTTKGEPQDVAFMTLSPPRSHVRSLERGPQRRAADLKNFDEYVYTRYVDGESNYPKVDEDYALKRYAEHYANGVLDEEAYNYGVLAFERAYVDEDKRDEHLLRCRDVLRVYRDQSGEEWEEIDDRHDEAQDTIEGEGLAWPLREQPRLPLAIGTADGVVELFLDLEGRGVYAHDAGQGGWWRLSESVSEFLNGLEVSPKDATPEAGPVELLAECGAQIAAGKRRKAARTFADALERDRKSKPVLDAVQELLEGLEPLDAAQLVAAILLVGDRTSGESAKAALQAVSPPFALQMIEAVGDFDEDGSQIALLVDCAAALRKKSHELVRKVAKARRDGRSKRQVRTMRNPFYK